MNLGRESDGCVVPAKCPNQGGGPSPAEGMEGKRPTKENTGQTAASQMQSWMNASAGLKRVRGAAKRDKRLRFTALLPNVAGIRDEPGQAAGGLAPSRTPGHVSRATFQESLYSQAGWATAAPGHSCPGECSTGPRVERKRELIVYGVFINACSERRLEWSATCSPSGHIPSS